MSGKFNKIVEIMPENMPVWMTEALLGGRLAIACMEVIEAQETAIGQLQTKIGKIEAENVRLRFIEDDFGTLKHKAAFQAKNMRQLGKRITNLVTTLGLVEDLIAAMEPGSMGKVPATNDQNAYDIRDMAIAKIREAAERDNERQKS